MLSQPQSRVPNSRDLSAAAVRAKQQPPSGLFRNDETVVDARATPAMVPPNTGVFVYEALRLGRTPFVQARRSVIAVG